MTPHLSALGFTLIHFCWQAALIGGLYKLLELTLPRLRNAERYLMGLVAMVAMLAVAVGTFVYEDLRLMREPAVIAMAPTFTPPARDEVTMEGLLPWLDAAWIVGVAVLAVRMAGGLWFIHRLEAAAQAVPDAVSRRFHALMQRASLSGVRIRLHPKIDGPFVIGAFRAVVYLPVSAVTSLSPDQLDAVLAHELEHVRRADYLWNLVQSAIETLFFFHPVVWWLGGRLREQRELCCDDAAVRLCRDPLTYATALLHLEEQRRLAPRLVMALNGEGSGRKLVSRIARLLGERTGPIRKGRTPAAYALPAVALILVAFAAPGAQVAAHNTDPSKILPATWTWTKTDVTEDEQPAQEMDDSTAATVESHSHTPAVSRLDDITGPDIRDREAAEGTGEALAMARDAADSARDWVVRTFAWNRDGEDWNARADAWKAQAEDWQVRSQEWQKQQDEWRKLGDAWQVQASDWTPSVEEQAEIRAEALAAQREALAEARAEMDANRDEIRREIDRARAEADRDSANDRREALREAEQARDEALREVEKARQEVERQWRALPPEAAEAPPVPDTRAAPAALAIPPSAPAAASAPAPRAVPAPPAAPAAPRAVVKAVTVTNTLPVVTDMAMKIRVDTKVKVKPAKVKPVKTIVLVDATADADPVVTFSE